MTVPYEIEFPNKNRTNIEELIKQGEARAIKLAKNAPQVLSNLATAEKNLATSSEETKFKLSKIIKHESSVEVAIKSHNHENIEVVKTTASLINTKYPEQPRIMLKNEIIQYSNFGVLKPAHTEALYNKSITQVRISQQHPNVPQHLDKGYDELINKLMKLAKLISKLPKN